MEVVRVEPWNFVRVLIMRVSIKLEVLVHISEFLGKKLMNCQRCLR